MTCREATELIGALLDRELSVPDMLRLQAHVVECDGCRSAEASEAWLHSVLAAGALAEEPPASLLLRIRDRIAEDGSATRRRLPRWRRAFLPALVGGLLSAAVSLLLWFHEEAARQWTAALEAVSEQHQHFAVTGVRPALDIAGADPERLEEWIRERVGLAISLPREAGRGERLIGARTATVAGQPAAHVLYAAGERRVSLFVSRRPSRRPPETGEHIVEGVEVYVTALGNGSIGWWQDGSRFYVAVSSGDEEQVLALAARCVQMERAPAEPRGVSRPDAERRRAAAPRALPVG